MTVFEGLGFYNDSAARAATLRGRGSLTTGSNGNRRRVAPASFASPREAATELILALEHNDPDALQALLGPEHAMLFSSGNDGADAYQREQFVAAYRLRHDLVEWGGGTVLLAVGDHAWPLPLPIVAIDGSWYLDGAAGSDEVLARRIGHNELGAIAVCRGFIAAQTVYAAEGRDGNPPGIFAARLTSDRGRHNGLYWPAAEGDCPSPAALPVSGIPGVAAIPMKLLYDLAPKPGGKQPPLHGYFFRMLFAQGAHATGGRRDYFVSGCLIGGIALLGWPARYRGSGVMSFLVNHEGVVYEKDLGADTAATADAIDCFDPDGSWRSTPSP